MVHCPEDGSVADLFAKVDYFASHLDEESFKELLKSLLTELFYYLKISENEFYIDSSHLSPILSKAIDYINGNLFTLRGVKEIADNLYVSEQYLYRIFKIR